MNESLQETLRFLAQVLHWLGRYRESAILSRLACLTSLLGLTTDEELETYIEKESSTWKRSQESS